MGLLTREYLRGQKVRLGTYKEEDYELMAEWFQDSYFLRHLDAIAARPLNAAQVKKKIESALESNNGFTFAVRKIDTDEIVGMADVEAILWNQGVTWVSLGMGTEHRGKGYGREALTMLIDYAFQELNLRRVQLTVFAYNAPGIHLYESLGFVQEGRYREFLQRDGQTYDMILYGLLRREWEARRNA